MMRRVYVAGFAQSLDEAFDYHAKFRLRGPYGTHYRIEEIQYTRLYKALLGSIHRGSGSLFPDDGHTQVLGAAKVAVKLPRQLRALYALRAAFFETRPRATTRSELVDRMLELYRTTPMKKLRRLALPPIKAWARVGVQAARCFADSLPYPHPQATAKLLTAMGVTAVDPDEHDLIAVNYILAHVGAQAGQLMSSLPVSVHDLGHTLGLITPSPTFSRWLVRVAAKAIRTRVAQGEFDSLGMLRVIGTRWQDHWEKLSFAKAREEAAKLAVAFIGEAAPACAEAQLHEEQAIEYKQWLDDHPPEEDASARIPYVRVTGADIGLEGDWVFETLRPKDPLGPLLGLLTDCCQHPRGEGAACAAHGYMSPLGGFVTVRYKGRVVAQSWCWRGSSPYSNTLDVLCVDNIEALGTAYTEGIMRLYKAAAERMIGVDGIRTITVGADYDDAGVSRLPINPWLATPADYSGYRDSKKRQHLLAEVNDAKG
jgi:hypothetical protein